MRDNKTTIEPAIVDIDTIKARTVFLGIVFFLIATYLNVHVVILVSALIRHTNTLLSIILILATEVFGIWVMHHLIRFKLKKAALTERFGETFETRELEYNRAISYRFASTSILLNIPLASFAGNLIDWLFWSMTIFTCLLLWRIRFILLGKHNLFGVREVNEIGAYCHNPKWWWGNWWSQLWMIGPWLLVYLLLHVHLLFGRTHKQLDESTLESIRNKPQPKFWINHQQAIPLIRTTNNYESIKDDVKDSIEQTGVSKLAKNLENQVLHLRCHMLLACPLIYSIVSYFIFIPELLIVIMLLPLLIPLWLNSRLQKNRKKFQFKLHIINLISIVLTAILPANQVFTSVLTGPDQLKQHIPSILTLVILALLSLWQFRFYRQTFGKNQLESDNSIGTCLYYHHKPPTTIQALIAGKHKQKNKFIRNFCLISIVISFATFTTLPFVSLTLLVLCCWMVVNEKQKTQLSANEIHLFDARPVVLML